MKIVMIFLVRSFCKEADKLIMLVNDCVAIRNKYTVLNLLLNRTKHQLIKRLNTLKLQPSCKGELLFLEIVNVCFYIKMFSFFRTH